MNDELSVTSPARSLINGEIVTIEKMEEAVDVALEELNKTNDNSKIDVLIKNVIGLEKISKFALCRILYSYEQWWERTEQNEIRGDTFQDYIESVSGISPLQMRRYISVWRHRDLKNMPKEIEFLPLSSQIDITTRLLDEGHIPNKEQWEELIDAQNPSDLSRIIRKIQGKPPTKGAYMLYWERSGDLVVWHQDQRFQVGYIDRADSKDVDNELERKVLEKIEARLTNSGLKATKK